MAKRKSPTADALPQTVPQVVTVARPVIHIGTIAKVQFGYVENDSLVPLEPISFTLNAVNEASLSEFWGLVEQARQKVIMEVNPPRSPAESAPPSE